MTVSPSRIFFDTNVYIIGFAAPESNEFRCLQWAGLGQKQSSLIEVVISEILVKEILRVAKRLRNKDWSGEIVNKIWQNLQVFYVLVDEDELEIIENLGNIPREDAGVYLTAKTGKAQCFVSANYKLVKAIVEKTGEFECLTPEAFVNKYV
ncbi:MAG: PIN domain-containing protein [Okeania sp. SIO2D1]|nr:PIN domain-containing protein [Okeania sp. SIO2D1]